jgi:hypothetical protein
MNESHLTDRNVPDKLAATGTQSEAIGRLAGTWTETEHNEFLSAIEGFEEIDLELLK